MRIKRCSRCKQELPETSFWANKSTKDGLQHQCISCKKDSQEEWSLKNKESFSEYQTRWRKENPDKIKGYKLKAKYNISQEEYDNLLLKQGGVCDICFTTNNGTHQSGTNRAFVVDHCHKTGKVRGLLCHSCNLLLGNAKDCKTVLRNAILYLEKKTCE